MCIGKTLNNSRNDLEMNGCYCLVMKDSLYAFGGWCPGYRNLNIHELNLNNYIWRYIYIYPTNPEEGPLSKSGAWMVDYGEEMLCVMGGYGCPAAVRNFSALN